MASKKEIKSILKENLQTGKQFHLIKVALEAHLQRDLVSIEDYYVKYKCLKYCLDFWVEKCCLLLYNLEPEYLSENLEDINKLTIKALQRRHFPPELKFLSLNKPFEILEDFCSTYIPTDARQERTIILETFKSKIWNNVLDTVDQYRDAREYLETFQVLLTECGVTKLELISTLRLENMSVPLDDDDLSILKSCLEKMRQKYKDTLVVSKVINKILALHNNLVATDSAVDSEKLIVKNKLGIRFEYFKKPPCLTLEQDVLTVCGCALSISEVYAEVVKNLQNARVKEVHLYSPDVIVVDQNFQAEEFQGVNLVLSTTKLIISENCVWDFSGKSGQSAFTGLPPKAINPIQNGLDGEDGKPGESGGNVHILVGNIIGNGNATLHIRSNGGNGGNSQGGGEGGDGLDGQDGDSNTAINEDSFRAMIPKVSRFKNKASNKSQLKCYKALIEIMDIENGYLKENQCAYQANGEKFVYQSIVTAAGAEAGFSIYEGPIYTNAYGFYAWYFGSPGTQGSDGGHGGRGGRGGIGGYAGEIEIQISNKSHGGSKSSSPRNSGQLALITVEKKDGSSGKDAKPGKNGDPGKPGRNGVDHACVHPFNTLSGRAFYKGSLIKRNYEHKTEPSPYCGYAKTKIHFENSQREIIRLKNEQKRSEFKTRAPIKTSQKQRTILKSNTEQRFEHHCRRYFLNNEFKQMGTISNLGQQSLTSASIYQALQSIQIASRICDFNPRELIIPPRKRKLNKADKISAFKLAGQGNSLSSGPTMKSTNTFSSPLLKLLESLLQSSSQESESELDSSNFLEFSQSIQETIKNSKDKITLSLSKCEELFKTLQNYENMTPKFLQVKHALTQNFRYEMLHQLHTVMQLLPEVRLGKIRKLDPNFFLIFIKNGGQLENNSQNSNFHSQIASDIGEDLKNGIQKDSELSDSSLFLQYKTSMVEKGLGNFPKFIFYLNKYTKKHLKKLSKHSELPEEEDESNIRLLRNRQSSLRGPSRTHFLEKSFIQEYLEKEGIGSEHYQKVIPNLVIKICKWLKKKEVLEEYVKYLGKGDVTVMDEDIDVLATVYRIIIQIFKREETFEGKLRYSAQPLAITYHDTSTHHNNNSSITTLKLIETDTNFAPLVVAPIIFCQKAQIYIEILNDTARPEFFEDFHLQEKLQAIDGCFLNRRYAFGKLRTSSSSARDIDKLTEDLSSLLPEVPGIVQLAIISSTRFDNRVIAALVERLTWQGLNNLPTFVLVELGLSILNGDEVDMLHLEWILSSLPQSKWVLEISFIIFQQFFQDIHQYQISEWKEKLSNLDPMGLILLLEKCSIYFTDCRRSMVDEAFQNTRLISAITQISSIVQETGLSSQEIYEELLEIRVQDWPKQLTNIKIRKTLRILTSKWEKEEEEEFKKCIYYVSSLHNEYPTFIDESLRILRRAKETHPRTEIGTDKVVEIFSNYYHGYWTVPTGGLDEEKIDSFEFFYTVLAHQNDAKIKKGERTRDEILKFITHDKNTTLGQMALQKVLFELRAEPKSGVGFLDPEVPVKLALTKWGQKVRQVGQPKPSIGEMIYCINTAIFQCKRFYLRDTQKVSLVAMLEEEERNVLAQVATGEGKSLIVVAWAIIKCLFGGKCDVITSSSILAERDAAENKDIFAIFQISVAHNSGDIEARKSAYQKDVVYGDVANFQRDYLLNKYHDTNMLGERSALENVSVMVDEVDSMLLDKGNSVLYLSHKPTGVEDINPIFIFIWKTMNLNSDPEEPVTFDLVKKVTLSEIFTIITPSMLKCLDYNQLGTGDSIHQALHELGYLGMNDRFISRDVTKPTLPDHLATYLNPLWYIIKAEEARKRVFQIPKHLEEFVDLHLDMWVSSAFRALELIPGKEYIVDTASKSYITPDKDIKVIIVDIDTGVDLFQSQWNDGLHQFLQLKHQCSFSNLSLKAIFISNISYFKKYGVIHGLTGTLGSETERNFLKKSYAVDFVNIPTATAKKFVEELPIVVGGSLEEWRERIVGKSTELVAGKRSVLIICESINDADYLHLGLVNKARKINSGLSIEKIHIYKRSYEKFSFLSESERELESGQIIISTNLAGRGTDIKISKDLNEAGGLCVLLSYLPNNIRQGIFDPIISICPIKGFFIGKCFLKVRLYSTIPLSDR